MASLWNMPIATITTLVLWGPLLRKTLQTNLTQEYRYKKICRKLSATQDQQYIKDNSLELI